MIAHQKAAMSQLFATSVANYSQMFSARSTKIFGPLTKKIRPHTQSFLVLVFIQRFLPGQSRGKILSRKLAG
jgi:hypothetical protein